MIKEDKRLAHTFRLTLSYMGEWEISLRTGKLNRAWGKNKVTITAEGDTPESSTLFLHGNFNGNYFDFLPMKRSHVRKDHWAVDLELPPGGLLQITLSMEDNQIRYWDPAGYRRILIDPPVMERLRLYSYIPNGLFTQWIKDLDNIEKMGFNGIHLLPLTQMGYSRSPYAAKNLFETDPCWGDPKDFNHFIDECEKRGMALCFDVVLNHISCDSELAKTKAHWIKGDRSRRDGMQRAGCWHQNSWISWEELVLIDYDHPDQAIREEIWNYMRDYLLYWAGLASRTGGLIRLDNLHSSHKGFIEWVLEELHRQLPGTAVFSEFFGSTEQLSDGVSRWGLNLLLGNTWEYPFVPQLEKYLKLIHANPELRYLLMPTTHDTDSISHLFGSPASILPRYLSCALMGTGQAGITMGSEWGEQEKIIFINRTGRQRYTPTDDFRESIGKINDLLVRDDIFKYPGNGEFLIAPCDSLLIFRRWSVSYNREVYIMANFDIHKQHEFHIEGPYKVLLNLSAHFNEWDNRTEIIIGPCGAVVVELIKHKE